MAYEEKRPVPPQRLVLADRSVLEVTGVQEVLHFDDESVLVQTVQGELAIEGADLHIDSLNLESGALGLSGRINALKYGAAEEQRGFFARLFG